MASARDIRTKIASIRNTQKITKAMETVAAAKMRKAQQRMRAGIPYWKRVRSVLRHLHFSQTEYRHLTLILNKTRQAAITQEIAEISAGAAAV